MSECKGCKSKQKLFLGIFIGLMIMFVGWAPVVRQSMITWKVIDCSLAELAQSQCDPSLSHTQFHHFTNYNVLLLSS